MRKTYVVGDIHGCYESLLNLLELIDCARGTLIFLGDYINRGPDSQKVVSLVIQLKKELPRVITLLGNHEAMFLRYLKGEEGQQVFLRNGGQNTLKSYGIDPMRDNNHNIYIPAEHMAFFNNLLLNWEDDKYIFVHAGLQPGVHLSMQTKDWCLWARDEFISSAYNFGKQVIFGHTVFGEPLMRAEKIGIDTGAVYGGRLTCIVLPGEEFVSVPGQPNSGSSY